jgi:hypothetical protein
VQGLPAELPGVCVYRVAIVSERLDPSAQHSLSNHMIENSVRMALMPSPTLSLGTMRTRQHSLQFLRDSAGRVTHRQGASG